MINFSRTKRAGAVDSGMHKTLGRAEHRAAFFKALRVVLFLIATGLIWASALAAEANPPFALQDRADWPGDPYLVTNPDNSVAIVMNSALFSTNPAYQGKVNLLAGLENADPLSQWAYVIDATRKVGQVRRMATAILPQSVSHAIGLPPSPAARPALPVDSETNAVSSATSRWWPPMERWGLLVVVALLLTRTVWRYFHEGEDDDDFANHLSTLAVEHRWVFPFYLALLTAVAAAEFFQLGNFLFSLSILMLAAALRGYYCEGDFTNFPNSQKLHLALSLCLVWFSWRLGFQYQLSEFSRWNPAPVLVWLTLALATRFFLEAIHSPDFGAQHAAAKMLLAAFLATGIGGGIVGFIVWNVWKFQGSSWHGFFAGGLFADFVLGVTLFATGNPVFKQVVAGTILDAFLPSGFGQKVKQKKHLPSLLLLRHWRDQGDVEKAWQSAQTHLYKETRALPLWLFAMETAVLHRRQPAEALTILKRLCAAEEFHYDSRTVAVAQVQGWMAAAGFEFDAARFKLERPPLQPTALADKVEQKCREGRFGEAAQMLREVLAEDALNEPAFIQLVRLYAQDLKNRPGAEQLITDASETFNPNLLGFLSGSLEEWMRLPSRRLAKSGTFLNWWRTPRPEASGSNKMSFIAPPIAQAPARPEAVDPMSAYLERVKAAQAPLPDTSRVQDRVEKLLQERRLGSAVELIKQQAEAAPENFDLWLRYAEAYGQHCGDINTAERIIRRMDRSGHFKKVQMKKVLGQLKKWRKQHPTAQNNW